MIGEPPVLRPAVPRPARWPIAERANDLSHGAHPSTVLDMMGTACTPVRRHNAPGA